MELAETKKRCQELSEQATEKTDEVSGLCSVRFTLPCTACRHVHVMYRTGTYTVYVTCNVLCNTHTYCIYLLC